MRWNGTAASAVDLNPSLLGENSRSVAFDTNGTTQVGFGVGSATGLAYHAMAWSGTADSAIDLNDLLPFGAFLSTAMTIDAQGNIFGTATDLSGNIHAVEWMPLPEPASIVIALMGSILTFPMRASTESSFSKLIFPGKSALLLAFPVPAITLRE